MSCKRLVQRSISNGRWMYRGNAHCRGVALTFDDGPHPSRTERCLDLLQRKGVAATFFLVGMCVEKYPGIANRIAAEGHEIGNHTYAHMKLGNASMRDVRCQIEKSRDAIFNATGVNPKRFRPPHGEIGFNYLLYALRWGITTVMWSWDIKDLRAGNGENSLQSGDIVLMHDDEEADVENIPWIIDLARESGYQLLTIGDLMGE